MHKTIISLIVIWALALCVWGADGAFTTGTSFEKLAPGAFDPTLDDEGKSGDTYWMTTDTNGMTVVAYGSGEAYDYAAKGMTRNPFFTGANAKYLNLDVADPLERGIEPILSGAVSNVTLGSGIYSDTLVRFSTSLSAPAITNTDKIAVWLRETLEDDDTRKTNLVLTAGYYAGDLYRVVPRDYVLTNLVADGAWCRLTVCTVTNIVDSSRGRKAKDTSSSPVPGFTVYVDGRPAVGVPEDYVLGKDYREDLLTPEARVLRQERRLFPWLVGANDDKARSLSRFAFSGRGAADDMLFTTVRPSYDVVGSAFTLQWDYGVKSLKCIVDTASSSVTDEIVTALLTQNYRDYPLGANTQARVTVTNVVYDAEHDYTNGVWTAANDCTVAEQKVTSGVFVYDGESKNPIGRVAASRSVVSVGGNGYETFAEAKANAVLKGERTIVLETDVIISTNLQSKIYRDYGRFLVKEGDDFVLDLNGHTLQGCKWDGDYTINVNGGKLEIIDSVGNGRVLPPLDSKTNLAVNCYGTMEKSAPTLVISGGRFEGLVDIHRKPVPKIGPSAMMPICSIAGGSYTNVYGGSSFYLEQYATNAMVCFALDEDDYWENIAPEGAFIWSGRGEDTWWGTAGNWRGGVVPGAEDLAIFPRVADGMAWQVDFGEGVATKRLWMYADIEMTGVNDFSGVSVEKGDGCFVGAGTMTFVGALPEALAGDGGSSGIRIGTGWKGLVSISKVVSPVLLTDIDSWGVAGSKVEFAGVCGYVKDKSSHALAYELILRDDGSTPAWKNETGYTGSTVSFPKLTGGGTFESPKNSREISQVFKFVDVGDFTGSFRIGGKKLVLGAGSAASGAKAGTITFVNGVSVRSGLNWNGVGACFGHALCVYGNTNDVLMTYSGGIAPEVNHVVVELHLSGQTVTTNMLRAAEGNVTVVGIDALLGGNPVTAAELGSGLKSGDEVEIPAGSAVSVIGGKTIVNGTYWPSYYKLTALATSSSKYLVSLDESEVAPTLADFTLSSGSGKVLVKVANAKPGLYYGLRSVASLAESFEGAPTVWLEAESDAVTFEVEAEDASGFYQVIVTDRDPN